MANPEGDFIWYELMTRDPAGAKAFYDSVVPGWNVGAQSVTPPDAGEYRIIAHSDGMIAGVLTLTDAMIEGGAHPCWVGYINAPDVDAKVAEVTDAGGGVVMDAWDQPGVGRLAMVSDPQGNPFYLMSPLPPQGVEDATSTVFDPMKAGHIRWNELTTSDLDAALGFYPRHFGWKLEDAMDMGELGSYQFFSNNGVTLGAMMQQAPESPPVRWTYYFGVPDIDVAAAKVTAGGGTITFGPMEIPGGEYAMNAIDPDGAAFGLVGPKA